MISTTVKRILASIVLGSFSLISLVFAQTGTTSPISAYGMGESTDLSFSRGKAMSGTGISQNKPNNINLLNPASASSLKLTCFETGLNSNFRKSILTDTQTVKNTMTLGYLAGAFPAAKNWGIQLGFVPYSSSGFNVFYDAEDSLIGNVHSQYQASGGVNQVFLANGFRLGKNLAFGVNGAWLFGSQEKIYTNEFPDLQQVWDSKITNDRSYAGLDPSAGFILSTNTLKTEPSDSLKKVRKEIEALNNKIHSLSADSAKTSIDSARMEIEKLNQIMESIQTRRVKGDYKFSIGLTGHFPMEINVTEKVLTERYKYSGGFLTVDDTALMAKNKLKETLPLRVGFGISLSDDLSWTYALDASYADWSSFSNGYAKAGLNTAMRFAFGVEHLSKNKNNKKGYFHRCYYRGGLYYEIPSAKVASSALTEYGLSLGIGMPLKKSYSMINLSVSAGQRKVNSGTTYTEQYINAHLGLVINDKWFVRKKFD